MVFHWSLSDSKSPQVSRILLSILAVLNNVVFWMVSTRPPTSKSSSPFSNSLVTVPKAPITIGIIVTCMIHSFFNSLARSRYLSFFSHSFSFILWSAGTAKSRILQVLSFLLIIIIIIIIIIELKWCLYLSLFCLAETIPNFNVFDSKILVEVPGYFRNISSSNFVSGSWPVLICALRLEENKV